MADYPRPPAPLAPANARPFRAVWVLLAAIPVQISTFATMMGWAASGSSLAYFVLYSLVCAGAAYVQAQWGRKWGLELSVVGYVVAVVAAAMLFSGGSALMARQGLGRWSSVGTLLTVPLAMFLIGIPLARAGVKLGALLTWSLIGGLVAMVPSIAFGVAYSVFRWTTGLNFNVLQVGTVVAFCIFVWFTTRPIADALPQTR